MRILFFLVTLQTGGAERQVAQLAAGLAQRGHEVDMVVLYPGGQNWEWLCQQPRVHVQSLFAKRPRLPVLVGLQLGWAMKRLHDVVRLRRPAVVYSALYWGNVIAWGAVRTLREVRLVWTIQASHGELNWKRRLPCVLGKWLSPSVLLIIANSQVGLVDHERQGYRGKRHIVLRNGIDTEVFRPDLAARSRLRQEWGIAQNEKLIGLVGRLSPMKDHPTFLQQAAIVLAHGAENMRFVCVGDGPPTYRQKLHQLAHELGVAKHLIWAGMRYDMPAVYNALDVLCSSSAYGEGVSNVICEAMACGIPCVVTDVGDAAWIVQGLGKVVPPRQPQALAEGLLLTLQESSALQASLVRQRIVHSLSVQTLIESTEHLFLELHESLCKHSL